MGSLRRKWWAWLIGAVVLVLVVFTVLYPSSGDSPDVSTSHFLADVQAGRVTRIEVDGRDVEYQIEGSVESRTARLEPRDTVRGILADAGIEPGSPDYPEVVIDEGGTADVLRIVINFLPIIFIVGIVFFFLRQANKANERPPLNWFVTNFDPVCRATVNPGNAAGTSTFMSTTYHFCTSEHKAQFDADPPKYLLQK